MPRAPPRPILLATFAFLFITFFIFFRQQPPVTSSSLSDDHQLSFSAAHNAHADSISADTLKGEVVAPKLGNATAKAELGRASWRLFHTMLARFPEEPTADQSDALKSYIYLFARLYPCGECAAHFQSFLSKFPPQTSSRQAAAGWGCHIHNEVNKSLKKPLFDCQNLGDFYDCGCAEDEKAEKAEKAAAAAAAGAGAGARAGTETKAIPNHPAKSQEELVPEVEGDAMDADLLETVKTNGRTMDVQALKEAAVEIEKEGLTRGG